MKNKFLIALQCALLLSTSGCFYNRSPKVMLPSMPPLSSELVEQTARSCPKEIERLRSRISYVPQERRDEFKTVLGLAEKACKEIMNTLERLKSNNYHEKLLRKNLEHAETIIVPGASIINSSSSKNNEILEDSISKEPLR